MQLHYYTPSRLYFQVSDMINYQTSFLVYSNTFFRPISPKVFISNPLLMELSITRTQLSTHLSARGELYGPSKQVMLTQVQILAPALP